MQWIWFELGEDTLHTNYDRTLDDKLRKTLMDSYFTPTPGETAVRLIGKDANLKRAHVPGASDKLPF